jgi:hypothetical protein
MRSAFEVNTNATVIADILGRDITERIPHVTARAFNAVRDRIVTGERRVMKRVFDRPTPYTLRSFFATKATPAKLRTEVGLRDWSPKGTSATRYISPHVFGGQRRHSRFERLMQYRGLIGGNEYLIPAPGAELDSYGNVKRGTYTRVLSAFQALRETGYQGNRTGSKRSQRKAAKYQFFIGADADGARAIWQRMDSAFGQGLKPIFWVTSREPRYRKRFAFFEIAENIHKANYDREWAKELEMDDIIQRTMKRT